MLELKFPLTIPPLVFVFAVETRWNEAAQMESLQQSSKLEIEFALEDLIQPVILRTQQLICFLRWHLYPSFGRVPQMGFRLSPAPLFAADQSLARSLSDRIRFRQPLVYRVLVAEPQSCRLRWRSLAF